MTVRQWIEIDSGKVAIQLPDWEVMEGHETAAIIYQHKNNGGTCTVTVKGSLGKHRHHEGVLRIQLDGYEPPFES